MGGGELQNVEKDKDLNEECKDERVVEDKSDNQDPFVESIKAFEDEEKR